MANIAYDNVTTNDPGSQSSYSFNHAVAGTDRVLYVIVSIRAGGGETVSGITYNGVALTKKAEKTSTTPGNVNRTELWELKNPASGTHAVAVTMSTTVRTGAVAISFTGAEGVEGTVAQTDGSSSSPSNSVTTIADNDWVLDAVTLLSDTISSTPGSGQTERADFGWSSGFNGGRTIVTHAGPKTPAGSVTMSETLSASDTWSKVSVAIKPAGGIDDINFKWRPVTTSSKTKSLAYEIKTSPGITKSLKYTLKTTPSAKTKSLKYGIKTVIAKTKTLKYCVLTTPTVGAINHSSQNLSSSVADQGDGSYTVGNLTGVEDIGGLIASGALASFTYGDVEQFDSILCEGFNFAIPTNATITGIEVRIKRTASQNSDNGVSQARYITDYNIQLVKANTAQGSNKADTVTRWDNTQFITKTYGSNNDLWGLSLTPSDINASNFGVIAQFQGEDSSGGTTSINIDFISIEVYYTVPNSQKTLTYRVDASKAITKSLKYTVKTTPASKTKSLRYAIAVSHPLTKSLKYVAKSPTQILKALKYTIPTTPAGKTKSLRYGIRTTSSFNKQLKYSINQNAIDSIVLRWKAFTTTPFTRSLKYTVKKAAPALTKSLKYTVINFSNVITKSLKYNLPSPTLVQKTITYKVKPSRKLTSSLKYTIVWTPILTYMVDENGNFIVDENGNRIIATSGTPTKALQYIIKSTKPITKSLKYSVGKFTRSTTKSLRYAIDIATPITKSLAYIIHGQGIDLTKSLKYTVKKTLSITKSLQYKLLVTSTHSITKSLKYEVVIAANNITKLITYRVKSPKLIIRQLRYAIKITHATTKSLQYIVLRSPALTKALRYIILSTHPTTKTLKYEVKKTPSITKALTYRVLTRTAITKALRYAIRVVRPITKSLGYFIPQSGILAKTLRYTVKMSNVTTKSIKYGIRTQKITNRVLVYNIRATKPVITKSLTYTMRHKDVISITKQLRYHVKVRGRMFRRGGMDFTFISRMYNKKSGDSYN